MSAVNRSIASLPLVASGSKNMLSIGTHAHKTSQHVTRCSSIVPLFDKDNSKIEWLNNSDRPKQEAQHQPRQHSYSRFRLGLSSYPSEARVLVPGWTRVLVPGEAPLLVPGARRVLVPGPVHRLVLVPGAAHVLVPGGSPGLYSYLVGW